MKPRSASVGGRPPWMEKILQERPQIPHSFILHSYTKPTLCQLCKKLLAGIYRQGYQCKDCKFNVHKRCIKRTTAQCTGEPPKGPNGKLNLVNWFNNSPNYLTIVNKSNSSQIFVCTLKIFWDMS